MINRAKETAKNMNVKIEEAYTMPTEEDIKAIEKKTGEKANTNPYMAIIKGDGVEIMVDSLGRTIIDFKPTKKNTRRIYFI